MQNLKPSVSTSVHPLFSFVGTSRPTRPKDLKQTQVPTDLAALLDEYPEFKGYQFPTRKPDACKRALFERATKGHRKPPPWLPGELNFVFDQMEFDEGAIPRRPRWLAEKRLPTKQEVFSKVCNLSSDSNAGFPYCYAGEFKRKFAQDNFAFVYSRVVERLLTLLEHPDLSESGWEPIELVSRGYVDPVLVFEKDEAYAVGKTERVIIMGSVVDEIIDRLITDEHDQFELLNYGRFYSLCGIGFNKDHHDHVVASVRQMDEDLRPFLPGPDRIAASDVSAFDFNMTGDDARVEALCVLLRYGMLDNSFAMRVMLNRTYVSMYSVYVFTDGVMIQQTKLGIQKSGLKRTTSRNTNVRRINFLRALFRAQPGVCLEVFGRTKIPTRGVGDDMLEPCFDGIEQAYVEMGVTIKKGSFVRCNPGEFVTCSHTWGRGHPVPHNAAKSAFTLLCDEPMPDKYGQWIQAYWHAPDRERYMRLFDRLGWPVGRRS